MKIEKREVKTKIDGKEVVLGEVEVKIYEGVDEAVKAETADKVLKLFNRQNVIQVMDNFRNLKLGKNVVDPDLKAIYEKAKGDEVLMAKIKALLAGG